MCCVFGYYRFRLYAELLSLCLRERESNQRESAPGIRVSLRETSLVPALFRGSSRWAIPGPSFLVWHPCQTPLYTAPALGLLTGPRDRGVCKFVGAVLTAKLLTMPARFTIKHNHLRENGCLATRFWYLVTEPKGCRLALRGGSGVLPGRRCVLPVARSGCRGAGCRGVLLAGR